MSKERSWWNEYLRALLEPHFWAGVTAALICTVVVMMLMAVLVWAIR